jgi:hypothetical protein
MKRLGHLHPKLEVPRLTCPTWNEIQASAVGALYRKEPFEHLSLLAMVAIASESVTWLSPVHVVT